MQVVQKIVIIRCGYKYNTMLDSNRNPCMDQVVCSPVNGLVGWSSTPAALINFFACRIPGFSHTSSTPDAQYPHAGFFSHTW